MGIHFGITTPGMTNNSNTCNVFLQGIFMQISFYTESDGELYLSYH
jgi:hypothetical protein